jgi:hypothetical protein
MLVADFGQSSRQAGGLLARFHRRGHVQATDVINLLEGAGFELVDDGSVGLQSLQFALATAPSSV